MSRFGADTAQERVKAVAVCSEAADHVALASPYSTKIATRLGCEVLPTTADRIAMMRAYSAKIATRH